MPRTDSERLDWLEAKLRDTTEQESVIVLAAWWSGEPKPDGFSVNVGECFPDMNEHTSLREAIDDAIEQDKP